MQDQNNSIERTIWQNVHDFQGNKYLAKTVDVRGFYESYNNAAYFSDDKVGWRMRS